MEDTMKRMYHLNSTINELQEKLDKGEIDADAFADTKSALIDASSDNFESLANWYRKNESRINERADAIKDLQAQKKHYEAVNKSIKNMLHNMLKELDAESYTAGLNRITTRPSKRLVINDITKIPNEFFKAIPKPDVQGIKDAIQNGETIPGATIEKFENINIK